MFGTFTDLSAAVLGITCMTPMAPTRLRTFWSSPDSSISLGGQQQGFELELLAVLLKEVDHAEEPFLGFLLGGTLQILG